MSTLRHVCNLALVTAFPAAFVLWHFPYATDDPVRREDAVREFFDIAFSEPSAVRKGDEFTLRSASMRKQVYVQDRVRDFVERYHLRDAGLEHDTLLYGRDGTKARPAGSPPVPGRSG